MFFDRAKRSGEPALSEVEWGPAGLSTSRRMHTEAPALPFVIPTEVPMGLLPTQRMKNGLYLATALHGSVALSFVIPSEAEGSAVPLPAPTLQT
jgi:hypothetical protein